MSPGRQIPIGMPPQHRGYSGTGEYRRRLLNSAWPYLAVSILVFGISVVAAENPVWPLFAAGWVVAATCLLIAWLNPQLWLVAPFGAIGAIVLIRWGTDGLGAGLGPLVLVPVVAVALYGSRRALATIITLTAFVILAIHLVAGRSDLVLTTAWRQDLVMLVLAAMLGLAVHSLVSRLRAERLLSEAREIRLKRVSEIARAIATSSEPARTICQETVKLTAARGAALYRHLPAGPQLLAREGSRQTGPDDPGTDPVRRALDRFGKDPLAGWVLCRDDDPGTEGLRQSFGGPEPLQIVLAPIRSETELTGLLAVAWPADRSPEESEVPFDLLAADASISIRNQELTERLERLALTDPLTEVANRRGWEQQIGSSLNSGARHQRPVCVAVLDLDGFKTYNDRYGHRAGDLLLTVSVARWRDSIRGCDHLSRFGGDEFVVTLPETALEKAVMVTRRMCDAVPGQVKCSAGVAEWDGTESAAELLDRADRALYEAKAVQPGTVRAAATGIPAEPA